mmetsp:Transcript_7730/g.28042  ORF Transcript_7730/g.28042 Transcript_7730/m.28042 type:complete len:206 (+) Transcript_7730:1777-2394(+)
MDELVQVLVPDVGVLPLEVRPHQKEDVITQHGVVVQDSLLDELLDALLHVIVLQVIVVLEWITLALLKVEAEAGGRLVVSVRPDLRQDGLGLAESHARGPEHLHSLLQLSLLQVDVVRPPQDHRVEAQVVAKEVGLGGGVAERVELPPGFGDVPKVFHQKTVTPRRLVNHSYEVGSRLVVHAPAPVRKGELLVLHQRPGGLPLLL